MVGRPKKKPRGLKKRLPDAVKTEAASPLPHETIFSVLKHLPETRIWYTGDELADTLRRGFPFWLTGDHVMAAMATYNKGGRTFSSMREKLPGCKHDFYYSRLSCMDSETPRTHYLNLDAALADITTPSSYV